MTADARANVRAHVAGQVSESTAWLVIVLIEDAMRLRSVDPRPPCILCDQQLESLFCSIYVQSDNSYD